LYGTQRRRTEIGSAALAPGVERGSRNRDRLAVVPRIAGAELHARPCVVEHRLAVPEVGGARGPDLELVAELAELRPDLLRNAGLDLDVAAFERAFGEAARLQRLLDAHPVVDHVDHELRMRLRLVPASHDAESDLHLALLEEPGDDGVQRTLARRERVGQARLEREQGSAVVQHEPFVLGDQPRAESRVVALDERDDVAVAVHYRQVDRVASPGIGDRGELGGLDLARGGFRVDARGPRRGARLPEELRAGDL